MTRVALAPSAFHPSLGGVEELSRHLAHQLGDVLVVTNRWPRGLPTHETVEGTDVHRFAFRTPVGGTKAQLSYPLSHRRELRRLAGLLRRERAGLVHVQCVGPQALYATAAARRLGLPLVVSLQGELTMDAAQIFQRSEFMRAVLRSTLTAADAVTACTRATLTEAEDFLGASFGSRGRVVHNGVEVAEMQAPSTGRRERPYVFALGRHVPQKGFDLLVRAWAQVQDPRQLVIAGEGPETEPLRALAGQLGVDLALVGRTDRAATVALFQGCDLFVLPSRHEPQGIVTLEAMAAGKAVLATDVGGVSEVVEDGRTGRLVAGGSAEALAQGLRELLPDEAARARLGAAGRLRAADFDWSALAAQYREVYRTVAR